MSKQKPAKTARLGARNKTQKGTKSPTETPSKLVVPSHGNGRIWQGPAANPVAGPGRPPDRIRERLRGSFEDRIALLEQIADGLLKDEKVTVQDRTRALDMLAKYGLGTKDEIDVRTHPAVQAFLAAVYDEAVESFGLEQARGFADRVTARLGAKEG